MLLCKRGRRAAFPVLCVVDNTRKVHASINHKGWAGRETLAGNTMKKQFLECGEIVATHGLRGEVRVYPWCDSPEFLASLKRVYLKKGERQLDVERARVHKNIVILKLAGIDTIEDAALLRKKVVYLNRDDAPLDEDAFFVQDLIGASVVDVDTNEQYGILTDVLQTGANDVYVIKNGDAEHLIPAIPQVVIHTDPDAGVISIRPLPGLFNPEE